MIEANRDRSTEESSEEMAIESRKQLNELGFTEDHLLRILHHTNYFRQKRTAEFILGKFKVP